MFRGKMHGTFAHILSNFHKCLTLTPTVHCNLSTPLWCTFTMASVQPTALPCDASIIFSLSYAHKNTHTQVHTFQYLWNENFSNNTIGLLWCYSENDTLTWLMLFVNLISNAPNCLHSSVSRSFSFFFCSLSLSPSVCLCRFLPAISFQSFCSFLLKISVAKFSKEERERERKGVRAVKSSCRKKKQLKKVMIYHHNTFRTLNKMCTFIHLFASLAYKSMLGY